MQGMRSMARRWMRPAATCALAVLLAVEAGCVLPVRRAPAARGTLVDAETGRPVSGALVVVRFDGWYDDALPDRDLLGHREARSGPDGRFAAGPLSRPGASAWPLLQTEARAVGVLAEGYLCPPAQVLRAAGTTIGLVRARDDEERRASCRPVASEPDEASAYMDAWRGLHRVRVEAEARERQGELDRLLAARATFGFGENCLGPVLDLSLDPSGRRAALVTRGAGGESRIQVVDLRGRSRPVALAELEPGPHQRVAWTSPAELVLWEPSSSQRKVISGSILGDGGFQVIWSAPERDAAAAAGVRLSGGSGPSRPIEPADLNDEGDSRWLGRTFQTRRDVDAPTGLGRDVLVVTSPEGSRREIALPGEACGPRGRFGRAHYRISEDGQSGLDLRFVDGGCHALRIELETGRTSRLDAARSPAECRLVRSVPAQQLQGALRGYMREVQAALEEAGADPTTAYALHVDPRRGTRAVTRDLRGVEHSVEVPPFPLATPLRRIEVTVAGGRAPVPPVYPTPAAISRRP